MKVNSKMDSLFQNIGVIILAGGKSERMKFPKPFLEMNGKTLLEYCYDVYSEFTENIEVVLNEDFSKGKWEKTYNDLRSKMHICLNPHPEYGRFFSIQLGLARMSGKSFCFIQNIDNPVSPEVIVALGEKKKSNTYAAPIINGHSGHPILISKTIMNAIIHTESRDEALNTFLKKYPRIDVPVSEEKILFNLNTEDDFKSFLAIQTR